MSPWGSCWIIGVIPFKMAIRYWQLLLYVSGCCSPPPASARGWGCQLWLLDYIMFCSSATHYQHLSGDLLHSVISTGGGGVDNYVLSLSQGENLFSSRPVALHTQRVPGSMFACLPSLFPSSISCSLGVSKTDFDHFNSLIKLTGTPEKTSSRTRVDVGEVTVKRPDIYGVAKDSDDKLDGRGRRRGRRMGAE